MTAARSKKSTTPLPLELAFEIMRLAKESHKVIPGPDKVTTRGSSTALVDVSMLHETVPKNPSSYVPLYLGLVCRTWRHDVWMDSIFWDRSAVARWVRALSADDQRDDRDCVGFLLATIRVCLPRRGAISLADLKWAIVLLEVLLVKAPASYSMATDPHAQGASYYFPSWPHDAFSPPENPYPATYRRDVLAKQFAKIAYRTFIAAIALAGPNDIIVVEAQRLLKLALRLLQPTSTLEPAQETIKLAINCWKSSVSRWSDPSMWLLVGDLTQADHILSVDDAVNDAVHVIGLNEHLNTQTQGVLVVIENVLRARTTVDYRDVVRRITAAFCNNRQRVRAPLRLNDNVPAQKFLASLISLVRVVTIASNSAFVDLGLEALLTAILEHFGPLCTLSTNLFSHHYHALHEPLRSLAAALILSAGQLPTSVRTLMSTLLLDSFLVRPCSPIYNDTDWALNYEVTLAVCRAVRAGAVYICPHLSLPLVVTLDTAEAFMVASGSMPGAVFGGCLGLPYMSSTSFWDPGTCTEKKNLLWRGNSPIWFAKLRMQFLLMASPQESLEQLLAREIGMTRQAIMTLALPAPAPEVCMIPQCIARPCMRHCTECYA